MKHPMKVLSLLFLFLLSFPALLSAQFQQPTQDELKMTADSKAPGADAVFLNVTETDDNKLHNVSFYCRAKVLTEKGKELATVQVGYSGEMGEVTDIRARTIHADGTIVPLVGTPAALLVTKKGDFDIERKVFNMPSVEVGSILEYYYQFRYDDNYIFSPYWRIQAPYFIHKAHYLFTPRVEGMSLLWSVNLPAGMSLNPGAMGRYSLDLNDIPAAPKEEWMPPIDNFLYHVRFYYGVGSTVDAYWSEAIKGWSKDVNRFADPSKAIHDAVNGIIATGDDDREKARKLYKAVQALDNTDFSRKKTESERKELHLKEIKNADQTWAQKSGSKEEIALLYLAMLRAAGLTANAMRVVDRERGLFAADYFSFAQLDDTVILLSLNGKEVVLDPGEKMCPFLLTHWRNSVATGVRQGANSGIATSPGQLYSDNKTNRFAEVTLDEQGGITGNVNFTMTGQQALYWRQEALKNDAEELKKQFVHWVDPMLPEGVAAEIDQYQGIDDPDSNLMLSFKVHGTLGAVTSKRVIIPGAFFETRGKHPFVDQEKRLESVDMHYPEQVNDRMIYHLPAGLMIEGAPQDAKFAWAGHTAFLAKTVATPGQITVTRSLARAFTLAAPDGYKDLRDFYQKVAAADQQQLVLTSASAVTATPAAKGN
jgi:hypothetical protein